ncbi:MAG TPA: ROK family protein [Phycisphaerales bacterium]|nr:ROK family protein [Phycisphaerales bacterium]
MPKPKQLVAGIDLGGTNIQAGVVQLSGSGEATVLGRGKRKTHADEGLEGVLGRVLEGLEAACEEAKVRPKDLRALGIGAPAPVDPEAGTVLEAVNLRWNDVPLAEILREKFAGGLPVAVDNDVNAAVYGEWRCGAGAGVTDLLGIWLGTGVGGGLILAGRLYHGALLTAGEIGHMTLFPRAPVGMRSLEQCCSRTAIARRLAALVRANHPSLLTELSKGEVGEIKSKTIAKAYQADDALTRQVVDDGAELVGIAAASAVTLLGLPRVVLGGGLSEALGEPFVERVREATRRNVFPRRLRTVDVVASTLMDDAGVIGAALIAAERAG